MVPRMRIINVSEEHAPKADDEVSLRPDDVILAIGDVENPTYMQMREVVEKHEDKELPVKVLRTNANGTEEALTVTVKPAKSADSGPSTIAPKHSAATSPTRPPAGCPTRPATRRSAAACRGSPTADSPRGRG